jgi:hypothetical protein
MSLNAPSSRLKNMRRKHIGCGIKIDKMTGLHYEKFLESFLLMVLDAQVSHILCVCVYISIIVCCVSVML